MTLEIVREKWDFIEEHTSLPLDEFMLSMKLVLESTYFLFNNKVYKQTFGTLVNKDTTSKEAKQ